MLQHKDIQKVGIVEMGWGNDGRQVPVQVPLMDLYEHSSLDGEGFSSTDRETEGGGGEAGGVHEVGAGEGLPGVADGLGGADRGAVQADQAA